jgi:hypothetical protein
MVSTGEKHPDHHPSFFLLLYGNFGEKARRRTSRFFLTGMWGKSMIQLKDSHIWEGQRQNLDHPAVPKARDT